VAPAGGLPRASRASRSACGATVGARRALTNDAALLDDQRPTMGFGCVVPHTPVRGDLHARRMKASCSGGEDMGIVDFFAGHRGLRAVARIDHRGVWQGIDLFANRFF